MTTNMICPRQSISSPFPSTKIAEQEESVKMRVGFEVRRHPFAVRSCRLIRLRAYAAPQQGGRNTNGGLWRTGPPSFCIPRLALGETAQGLLSAKAQPAETVTRAIYRIVQCTRVEAAIFE